MKWRTHRAITDKVLRHLGLGEDVVEACLEGVVEPDRRADFSLTLNSRGRLRLARRTHHSFLRNLDSLAYIYKARKCVLEGRYRDAGYNLGLALHYIQDRCIKEAFFIDHGELEAEAGRIPISEQAIKQGFRDSISNPFKIERIVLWSIWPSWTPGEAVWNAAYYTALISRAVFSLDPAEFEKARAEKEKLVRRAKKSALVFSACIAATFIASIISTSILLPLIIVDVTVMIPLAVILDRINRIRKWFRV
jgi:hypothetical protein